MLQATTISGLPGQLIFGLDHTSSLGWQVASMFFGRSANRYIQIDYTGYGNQFGTLTEDTVRRAYSALTRRALTMPLVASVRN